MKQATSFSAEYPPGFVLFRMHDVSGFGNEALAGELVAALPDESTDPAPNILVDCADVQNPNSMFLESLVQLSRRAHQRSVGFALCNVKAHLKEVLGISNLDRIWTIHESLEEALAS
ncbi:MAG: STAS domain-containing protein [Planctomycetaceae bacterium]